MPGLAQPLFGRFALVLAQNESLANRFSVLGAPATMSVGNLKVDAPAPLVDSAALEGLRAAFAGRPLLMAASTHDGEDQVVAEAHRTLAQSLPGLCTIIAPRDRKSTRLNSSHLGISYAVFCLKKKKKKEQ